MRLDYSGHGQSTGAFEDGTIGAWAEDARAIIEARTTGPLLLVGSSMGGWIGLLVARALPARTAALVGIAAAPDFTETLLWHGLTEAERTTLEIQRLHRTPQHLRRKTLPLHPRPDRGRPPAVPPRLPIPVRCPVRLLQGQQDPQRPLADRPAHRRTAGLHR